MSTARTPAEPVLPEPPAGHVWIDRGYGWTNDGKPTVHCVKSPRSPRIVNSKAAIKPSGGADFRFWEAVVAETEAVTPDAGFETAEGERGKFLTSLLTPVAPPTPEAEAPLTPHPPITVIPARTIEVVHAIPQPQAPVVPVSDPAFDAAWSSWRSSKAGQENVSVRGLDVSRLWTIMEARIRAAFEAGWNARE